jgi:hypothetical protein
MQLYDNEIPGLEAGTYEVTSTLSLPNSETDNFQSSTTQTFEVDGPRFAIDPDEVHARIPQSKANGDFSLVLPSVTLSTPALPWERAITDDPAVPWMALLLFTADELRVDPRSNSPLISSTVAEFLSPQAGRVKPDIDPSMLPAAQAGMTMNSVLIEPTLFTAVTPRLVELTSLAGVRRVDPSKQAVQGDSATRSYATVMANRFPLSTATGGGIGVRNFALLVSFEGLTDYLVDEPTWPAETDFVQVAVLAFWDFTSAEQPGMTFAELAEDLITSDQDSPSAWKLQIPVSDPGSSAASRLNEGYTALSYQTLIGVDSFAWYRGPFVPVPAQPLPASIDMVLRADRAAIYDEANAVFDHSYAAAWTISRLLALADPVFVNAVLALRKQLRITTVTAQERRRMPHLADTEDLTELLRPGATRRAFLSAVDGGLAEKLTQVLQEGRGAQESQSTSSAALSASAGGVATRAFLARPEVQTLLLDQAEGLSGALAEWLADLALLRGVPFVQLVPDQRMLPPESIRFFHVDPGWVKVLMDGALTVGIQDSFDLGLHRLTAPAIAARAQELLPTKRARLLGQDAALTKPTLPAAGMILRSALVSGWPGLTVEATCSGTPVELLRMTRLAPTILLLLWDETPDTVALSQPHQGIPFGAVDGWLLPLRSLDAGEVGAPLGGDFPSSGDLTQFMRPVVDGVGGLVLRFIPAIAGTLGYLVPALAADLGQGSTLSPAQLAVELLQLAEQIQFNPPKD